MSIKQIDKTILASIPTIVAIDPGKSGGIVIMRGSEISAHPMPDDVEQRDLLEFVSKSPEPVCYLELVGGFIAGNPAPGSAMFNFGDNFGYLRGLLSAYRIKTVLVRPQKWQKGIPGICGKGPDRKRALKEHAARLFPALKVTLDTADALCIAHYAQACEAGEVPTYPDAPATVAKEKKPVNEKIARSKKAVRATFDENPVAVELDALSPAQRMALAVAWCEKSGWPVPAPRTTERASMYDYWYNKAVNGEITP